jgi:phytanoyl-CoA hydroxylase
MKLSQQQLDDYHKDGFVIIPHFFSAEETKILYETSTEDSNLRENSYEMVDKQGKKSRLALWFTPGNDAYGMMSRSERMVNAVQDLLGGEVGHFHSKVMQKEPKVGGAWEWHQDYGYWYRNGFLYPDMISVMIALTLATKENGCLQVLKGSHKMGRVEHGTSGEQVGADTTRIEEAKLRHELVYCELQPGDALFFHCNLLHASAANLSDHSRWSIISAYNLLSNVPFHEKTTSCITPIQMVNDSELLRVGKKGIDRADFLSKNADISLEMNKQFAK